MRNIWATVHNEWYRGAPEEFVSLVLRIAEDGNVWEQIVIEKTELSTGRKVDQAVTTVRVV